MQPKEGATENAVADVHTTDETTELLRYLVQNCATKEDLKNFATKDDVKQMIGEAKHELMAYTDRRITEAENKFIMPLRREDEKVDEIVDSAEQRKLFERGAAARLKKLGPFPKLTAA